jgi:hypothetical protein
VSGGWSALSLFDVELTCDPGQLPPSARPAEREGTVLAQEQWMWLGPSEGGGVSVTLARIGPAIQVDSAAIVRAPRTGSALTLESGGRLARVERRPARQASAGTIELTGSLAGHRVSPGDRLTIRFDPTDGVYGLVIRTRSAAEPSVHEPSGIRVLWADETGSWATTAHASARATWNDFVVPGAAADSVCVEFGSGFELEAIERLVTSSGTGTLEPVPLDDAEHSRLGDLAGGSAELAAGEIMNLCATLPEGGERADVFLYLKTSAATGPSTRVRKDGTDDGPTAFALEQNEPNPFGEGTRIRFALPRPSFVTLDVFDLHGRRVATLTKREWQAGVHTVDWNGRNGQGRRVRPGIYLYRMEAEAFRATRKLVVLP